MKLLKMLGRQHLGTFENAARTVVAVFHFRFFVIGERQRMLLGTRLYFV